MLLLAAPAFAANTIYTWDASGTHPTAPTDGGGTWNTSSANWTNNATDVVFGNATTSQANIGAANGAAGTLAVSGNITNNFIQFNAPGSGSYTLGGSGTIFLGGSTPTISIAAAQTPVINTVIGEAAANTAVKFIATSAGSGSITLGGANTFTGASTIQQAAVIFNNLANGGTASSFGAGANTIGVVVGSGGSFASAKYNGSGGATDRPWSIGGTSVSDAIQNNGSGAISFNNTGAAVSGTAGARTLNLSGSYTAAANTFAETLSDMSGFTTALIVSGNTWTISGANTHTGGTILGSLGVLNLGNASALGSGTFTVAGNGSFDNLTGGDLAVANALAITNGSPTYIGSTNNMTINGAATMSFANRTITVTAKTLTLGGVLGDDNGSRTLTAAGSGVLTLLGANTYGGGTFINGTGTLMITNDAGLGVAGSALVFTNSGILAATNLGAALNNPVTIAAARTITVVTGKTANFFTPDTNSLIVAAAITGAGNVTKKSSSFSLGTVRFSNDGSDYTGDLTLGYGNTEFTSVANQGTASSLGKGAVGTGGTITIGNATSTGTLRYVGTNLSATTRPLNWTATGSGYALDASGTNPIAYLATSVLRSSGSGAVLLTLQGSNTGTNTLAQVINDSGGITTVTKTSGGTWVLGGANTYSGVTSINGGILSISAANNLGTGTAILFDGNATLLATAGLTVPNTSTITVTNSFAGTFDNTAAAGNPFEIAALITGSGAVKRSSESAFSKGAVRFSNDANNYTGFYSQGFGLTEFTSVGNGGAPSALGSAATAYALGNASSAVIFRYVGATGTSTTRAIDWQGTTGNLTLDNNGVGAVQYLATGNLRSGSGINGLILQGTNTGANVLAQVINDSGGVTTVTKAGANIWTLTGANTYSGNTIISAGTLALSGSGAIANSTNIIVATNATLDVTGLSSTFTLGASQTLSNNTSTANIAGNANTGTGTLSLTYAAGTPAFSIAGGTLTLATNTVAKVNNTGAQLAVGSYKLMAKGTGGAVAGTVPATVTVGGNGMAGGATAALSISNNELYLVIGSGTLYPPVISSFGLANSAAVLNFSGTNGQTWKILSSTNLTKALTNWDVVTNGTFAGVPVTYTNTTPVDPQRFYIITSP